MGSLGRATFTVHSILANPARIQTKSLHRSNARSHFYGTEYEVGLILGRLAMLKKKFGRL